MIIFNKELLVYNFLVILRVILRRKCHFKRNLGSPVKNCPKVSLIYLSESVRGGSISFDCDIYWGFVRDAHAYADTDLMQIHMQKQIKAN